MIKPFRFPIISLVWGRFGGKIGAIAKFKKNTVSPSLKPRFAKKESD
jgi:hypothetical protein